MTIKSDVSVMKYAANKKLSIYGDLDIDSEGGAKVTFQATSGSGPGIWKGIWFNGYNNPIITNNWWGQPSVPWNDIYAQGTILAWCPLSGPPGGLALAASSQDTNSVSEDQCVSTTQVESEFQDPMLRLIESIHYRQQNQYDQAAALQKQIIWENSHSDAAPAALWELAKTYIKAENKGYGSQLDNDLYSFLTAVSQIHAPGQQDSIEELYRISLKLMVGDRIRNHDYNIAIERARFLINEFSNSQLEEESLYDLFTLYWVFMKDTTQAKAAFVELQKKYPNSQFVTHAKIELGIDEGNVFKNEEISLASQTQTEIGPVEFELFPNYPNPFNPMTTIQYTLRHASHVTLQIFNLRGELVRTLVDVTQQAQLYQVIWNGKNDQGQAVAAGTYVCRFKADSFMQVRRLILLK